MLDPPDEMDPSHGGVRRRLVLAPRAALEGVEEAGEEMKLTWRAAFEFAAAAGDDVRAAVRSSLPRARASSTSAWR